MSPTHSAIRARRRAPVRELDEIRRARRRIEAMRLGVVPSVHDGIATSGDQQFRRWTWQTLEFAREGRGALQAIVGEYGSGKTHRLEAIRADALERNFIVARAVLDPRECTPSNPKRVYRRLVAGLTYPDPDAGSGLEHLLRRALESEPARRAFLVDQSVRPRDGLDEGAHLYLTPTLRYLDGLSSSQSLAAEETRVSLYDDLLRWIQGDPTIANSTISRSLARVVPGAGKLFSLKDYRPWARIYGYLLSGIARLAHLAGYAGLAMFVDEAEFHTALSAQNQYYALEFLRALAWAAKRGYSLPFGREALDGGGMGILKELPPHYGDESNLYVAMAFTPATACRETLANVMPRRWWHEVSAIGEEALADLGDGVVDDYKRAMPHTRIDPPQRAKLREVITALCQSGYLMTPRDVTRFVVSVLDLARHGELDRELERLSGRYTTNQDWGWSWNN